MNSIRLLQQLTIAVLFLLAIPAAAQDSLDKDYAGELPRIAPTEAEMTLDQFQLADPGLVVELVASEPLVMDPVAITFDEWGRAFVVEMRGYSERQDQKLGRVTRLVDRDGDGRFDESMVFAEGFRWPTGIVCFNGGFIVADAPDLVFLKDVDGDGSADFRQTVFTGFGTSNVQQLPNNLQWGLDNRIYGSSGGNGGRLSRVADLDDAQFGHIELVDFQPINLRGKDFVIDPRTLEASAITGGSQFGMTFDRWGNRFVCSNSNHCQQIIMEESYVRRNPVHQLASPCMNIAREGPAAEVFRISQVEPWRKVRTRLRVQGLVRGPVEGGGRAAGYFTSATGLIHYDGDALRRYNGNMFVGDVGSNLLHRKRLSGNRIVKTAERTDTDTEFLRSTDNWFRPVQSTVGPDGSLLILDMYRETIEHPASLPTVIKKHLDLNSGNNRGRIYRIVPKGFSAQPRLLPGNATEPELVQMLSHTNGWHRRTAMRLLAESGVTETALLHGAAGLKSLEAETRIRAMYLLHDQKELDNDALAQQLCDPQTEVQVHAIRIAESNRDPEIMELVFQMAGSRYRAVQFQAALSIGQFPVTEQTVDLLSRMSRDQARYPWISEAAESSIFAQRGRVLSLMARRYEIHNNSIYSREIVRQILLDPNDEDLSRVAKVMISSYPQRTSTLAVMLLTVQETPGRGTERLRQLLQLEQHSLTDMKKVVAERAVEVFTNGSFGAGYRLQNIKLLQLAEPEQVVRLLPSLLGLNQPTAVKAAAIQVATQFQDPQIASILIRNFDPLTPELRGQVVEILLSRRNWTETLVSCLQSGQLKPVFITASHRQRLVKHPDANIRQQAAIIWGDSVSNRDELVTAYRRSMSRLVGDIDRGRQLFRKSCSSCHELEKTGTAVGPNLAAFANRGREAMLTNILDPNREVDPRYLSYLFRTIDGQVLNGIIESESASTFKIRNSEGKSQEILVKEVEEMKSTTLSLMPENFEAEIDPQGMADLLEYLSSQGS